MKYNLIEFKRNFITRELEIKVSVDNEEREDKDSYLVSSESFWYYPASLYTIEEAIVVFKEKRIESIKNNTKKLIDAIKFAEIK